MYHIGASCFVFQDFDGQRRAETYFELILTVSAVIGFFAGYYMQMYSVTVGSLGAGFILAALVRVNSILTNPLPNRVLFQISIPPWPMYRRKPLKWQKHIPFDANNSNANSVATAGGDSLSGSKPAKKLGAGKGKKNN